MVVELFEKKTVKIVFLFFFFYLFFTGKPRRHRHRNQRPLLVALLFSVAPRSPFHRLFRYGLLNDLVRSTLIGIGSSCFLINGVIQRRSWLVLEAYSRRVKESISMY